MFASSEMIESEASHQLFFPGDVSRVALPVRGLAGVRVVSADAVIIVRTSSSSDLHASSLPVLKTNDSVSR